jgi:hypothetical protein
MSSPGDATLRCADCGRDFVWSAGEQAYYQEQGYPQPKRCKECRRAKRKRREAAAKEGGKQ